MMDGSSGCGLSTSAGGETDVKPLRTLAPMFPATVGLKASGPPPTGIPGFVFVTPFGSFAPGADATFPPSFRPLFPTLATPPSSGDAPLNPTPLTAARLDLNGSVRRAPVWAAATGAEPVVSGDPLSSTSSGRKSKRPVHLDGHQAGRSTYEKKARPEKAKRVLGGRTAVLQSFLSQEPRESVEAVLMAFEALRRRVLQLDEAKDATRRADLKVGNVMMNNDLRVNKAKRVGPVPGIEVGDMFYFRFEMLLVGLHSQVMAGIDRMTAKFGNEEDTVAIGIVSAGGYENEEEDVDVLIYSGQGGASGRNDKMIVDDQKLERGNLALERSLHWANGIRVIRSAKDPSSPTVKIYIYDGIYKVRESWIEKGKSGFNMFKFKLLREPGQPDGFAVWKRTQKWIEHPSLRGSVILSDISSGRENIPVCLVNDVDYEKGPCHFTYVTNVRYPSPIGSMKSFQRCMCQSVCLPGDASCSCAQQNEADLPYSSNGLLVSRKPLVYECTASCPCSVNCRNRVTQKGIRFHFEVFKTRDRGWGLRSWDPIRAGTFICEYTGEVIDKTRLGNDIEENNYVFQKLAQEKPLKWNYIPELLEEPSRAESSESSRPLPIIISAKNMGNVARFMNHSCSPNVFWQPVLYDHGDEGFPHIMFFAIKHIPPMTELTYDYGLSIAEGQGSGNGVGSHRTKKCLCGSSKCRGIFG
ncbi:histone-lysine N-methyltransferase, H3 lysine-9 specific SUVH1-like [Iris pallida]|uniref:Histone-lysine N-methyltransferase, H3 lysine-9 specific SUVH1-like n=1 Tax=Iris pallida TaxID=29817 RepID=A0AAX6IJK0_IRIPA|nr:histone-lysine N-methyltransferase, H3 lysine-9 specific SUVH1-like [Iris pallida]